jgi:hypothetical protein
MENLQLIRSHENIASCLIQKEIVEMATRRNSLLRAIMIRSDSSSDTRSTQTPKKLSRNTLPELYRNPLSQSRTSIINSKSNSVSTSQRKGLARSIRTQFKGSVQV